MTPTLTCDHCDSEIDVALDPRCVMYEPTGSTDVICEKCRERAWHQFQVGVRKFSDIIDPHIEAYRIKRGWRA